MWYIAHNNYFMLFCILEEVECYMRSMAIKMEDVREVWISMAAGHLIEGLDKMKSKFLIHIAILRGS